MGDSRTYRGLSPSEMEKELQNMKVFNFGYSNGGLNPVMFNAAQKIFSPESTTRMLVLGVAANCLTDYTQKNDQYIQEKNRPKEDVYQRLYLNPFLYLFPTTSPKELMEMGTKETSEYYYRNEYYSDGYVQSEKFPVDTMESISSYINDFTNFKVKDYYIDRLAKSVKECTNKGIVVIGFRPPTTVPMRALEDSMGLYNEALIKEKITEAGGYWIDLQNSEYKTYDGSHLDRNSALLLSKKISRDMKQILIDLE
jgi:hypothetical protein